MSEGNLPDPSDPVAVATFMLQNGEWLTQVQSWLAKSRYTLSKELEQKGVIHTPAGDFGKVPDAGWEYSPQIVDEFPGYGFGEFEVSFVVDKADDALRFLDLVLETMPDVEDRIRQKWKVVSKVDGKVVAQFIQRSQDDVTVARLKELRKSKTRLGRL